MAALTRVAAKLRYPGIDPFANRPLRRVLCRAPGYEECNHTEAGPEGHNAHAWRVVPAVRLRRTT
jgi:hypothetical protein